MNYQIGTQVFDDWVIVRAIGRGASGTVYEIQKSDESVELKAALKVMHVPQDDSLINELDSDGMDDQTITTYLKDIVGELEDEIKLMVSMKGFPYIVSCEDYKVLQNPGELSWDVLIRMELLQPLTAYQKEHDLTEKDVHRMAVQMAKALELLARKGIIHRDIKPENIFVTPYGDFKLGDFGIARVCDKASGDLSKKGTENYMAPEVYRGEVHYDGTVDIYSLGLVLYRMLNKNRLPFYPTDRAYSGLEKQMATADRISGKKEIPAPVQASGDLAGLILKMCAYEPEDRIRSAEELGKELEKISPSDRIISRRQESGEAGASVRPGAEDEGDRTDRIFRKSRTQSSIRDDVPPAVVRVERPVRNRAAEKTPDHSGAGSDASSGKPSEDHADTGTGRPAENPSDTGPKRPVRVREDDGESGRSREKAKKKKSWLLLLAVLAIVVAAVFTLLKALKFNLSVDNGSGSGSYKAGAKVTVTAQDVPGSEFSGWEAEGINLTPEQLASPEISFKMPMKSVKLSAQYTEVLFELIVNGGSGAGEYRMGEEVTVRADAPESGYEFSAWELDQGMLDQRNLKKEELTFTMPQERVEISSVYTPMLFHLKVNNAGGTGDYRYGEEITLEAEEVQHSTFLGWKIVSGLDRDGTAGTEAETEAETETQDLISGKEFTFAMGSCDAEITAVYALNEHTVTIKGGTGSGTYKVGDTVVISADESPEGSRFASWKALRGMPSMEDSSLETTQFTMPDNDVSIEAQFTGIEYTLVVAGGSGSGTHHYQDIVEISAEPADRGMAFLRWEIKKGDPRILTGSDDQTEDTQAYLEHEDITLMMPSEDVTIEAVYSAKEYSLEVQGGSGSGTYAYGDLATVSADEAAEGSVFSGWKVLKGRPSLEDSSLETTQFEMPDADVTLAAQYEPVDYKLTVKGADGTGTYHFGDTVTVSAETKKEGTSFTGWTVDKGSLDLEDASLETITFEMPSEDITLTARFEASKYTVTVENGSGSGTYAYGDTVSVSADEAAEGSEFSGWKALKGKPSLEDSSLETTQFEMPDADVTLAAQYSLIDYKLTVNGADGSGTCHFGDTVTVSAQSQKEGMTFTGWTVDKGSLKLSDASRANIVFEMPSEDITLTAHYTASKYKLTVKGGRGSGMFSAGDKVTVTAPAADPQGRAFVKWIVSKGSPALEEEDYTAAEITFEMPAEEVEIMAGFEAGTAPSGSHALTVNGGSGSGMYDAGTAVTITHDPPEPGMSFAYWLAVGYTESFNSTQDSLTITMPDSNVIFTAVFTSE